MSSSFLLLAENTENHGINSRNKEYKTIRRYFISFLASGHFLSYDSLCKQLGPRSVLTDRMSPGPDLHPNRLAQHANTEILVFIE